MGELFAFINNKHYQKSDRIDGRKWISYLRKHLKCIILVEILFDLPNWNELKYSRFYLPHLVWPNSRRVNST